MSISVFALKPSSERNICLFKHGYVMAAGSAKRSRQRQQSGGARRDRTDDLMLAKHALSQLSYGPEPGARHFEHSSANPKLPAPITHNPRLPE